MQPHVPRIDGRALSRQDFAAATAERRPVIFTGVAMGPCTQLWGDPAHLEKCCGLKPVAVHVTQVQQMDFVAKNFVYRTLPFGEAVRRCAKSQHDDFFISSSEMYYLRALGEDAKKEPAKLEESFPELAADFTPPDWVNEDTFSSVLRVTSSDVALWMHYDVFDNLLYQVCGRKRITMYAPCERLKLYCDGDKSKVGDPAVADPSQFPLLQKCEPLVCDLADGEVLYIPAMWFHHVKMLSFGIAVNTFFYHLPRSLFHCKDVYGNSDPLPAQKASKHLDLVVSSLQQLPPDTADFYARGYIERLSRALLIKPISGAEIEEFDIHKVMFDSKCD